MEIQETAPEAVIMICEQPGRKPRPLRLATIEDCDALITAATNAKWMILGAIAAVTPIDATIVDDEFCPDPHCFEPPGHEPPHMDSEGRTYGPGSDTILGPGDELSDDDDDEPGPMDDEAELRRADEIRYHGHVPSLDGTLRFCALA